MSTPGNAVRRKQEIDNALSEFLPKLTPKQQAALKLIAQSDKLPKSKVDWCKFLNVNRNAFYNWLCQRDWQQAFLTIVRLTQSLYIPTVIANVKSRTKRSDVASRLFLEYTGALNTQIQPVINTQVNIAVISEHRDQLKQIADQFSEGLMRQKAVNPDVQEAEIAVE